MGSWINPCASMNPFFSLGSWVKFGTELHRLDGLLGRNAHPIPFATVRAWPRGRAPGAGRRPRVGADARDHVPALHSSNSATHPAIAPRRALRVGERFASETDGKERRPY